MSLNSGLSLNQIFHCCRSTKLTKRFIQAAPEEREPSATNCRSPEVQSVMFECQKATGGTTEDDERTLNIVGASFKQLPGEGSHWIQEREMVSMPKPFATSH
jgi:hypothetical protein